MDLVRRQLPGGGRRLLLWRHAARAEDGRRLRPRRGRPPARALDADQGDDDAGRHLPPRPAALRDRRLAHRPLPPFRHAGRPLQHSAHAEPARRLHRPGDARRRTARRRREVRPRVPARAGRAHRRPELLRAGVVPAGDRREGAPLRGRRHLQALGRARGASDSEEDLPGAPLRRLHHERRRGVHPGDRPVAPRRQGRNRLARTGHHAHAHGGQPDPLHERRARLDPKLRQRRHPAERLEIHRLVQSVGRGARRQARHRQCPGDAGLLQLRTARTDVGTDRRRRPRRGAAARLQGGTEDRHQRRRHLHRHHPPVRPRASTTSPTSAAGTPWRWAR